MDMVALAAVASAFGGCLAGVRIGWQVHRMYSLMDESKCKCADSKLEKGTLNV